MQDETPPAAPTPAQHPGRPEQPAPLSGTSPPDDPTESAYLKITLGPSTVEAQGTIPLICVIGVLGAVATAYVAATRASGHGVVLLVALAAAELVLAATVIFRITRRSRITRQRKASPSQVNEPIHVAQAGRGEPRHSESRGNLPE